MEDQFQDWPLPMSMLTWACKRNGIQRESKSFELQNQGKSQDLELFVYLRRPRETGLKQGQNLSKHDQSLTLEEGMSYNPLDYTIKILSMPSK